MASTILKTRPQIGVIRLRARRSHRRLGSEKLLQYVSQTASGESHAALARVRNGCDARLKTRSPLYSRHAIIDMHPCLPGVGRAKLCRRKNPGLLFSQRRLPLTLLRPDPRSDPLFSSLVISVPCLANSPTELTPSSFARAQHPSPRPHRYRFRW